MGDVFKEQLIKRLPTKKDKQVKAGIVAAGVVVSVAVFFIMFQLALIVAAVLAFFIYYLFSLFDREFEYIFTNGDLEIDCIFAKSRRKRVFYGDIKEITLMAHASNKAREKEFETAKEILDCGSGVTGANTYYILTEYEGKRVKIIFEPNEMMFNAVKAYAGRKLDTGNR